MVRHQPEGLDQLQAQTQFTRKELQSLYRGFKNVWKQSAHSDSIIQILKGFWLNLQFLKLNIYYMDSEYVRLSGCSMCCFGLVLTFIKLLPHRWKHTYLNCDSSSQGYVPIAMLSLFIIMQWEYSHFIQDAHSTHRGFILISVLWLSLLTQRLWSAVPWQKKTKTLLSKFMTL